MMSAPGWWHHWRDLRHRIAAGSQREEPSTSGSAQDSPFFNQHTTIHQARSFALAEMPRGAQTLLSVGANGSWYFDWIEDHYGPVERHIAIEAYMPRPERLPGYVEWIAADIAAPEGLPTVPDSSVDLLFSGQNVEHLWPAQMVSFFSEANRVLRDGAWLVVDSPNRAFTAPYRWSMGEHTVELTPAEAVHLFELAGFDVVKVKGAWLCEENGQLLSLDPPAELAEAVRRIAVAPNRPAQSFLWWIESRRRRAPDLDALRASVDEIFAEVWEERVNRLRLVDGAPAVMSDGRAAGAMPKGAAGFIFMGPGFTLVPGTYEFFVELEWRDASNDGELLGFVEVVAGDEVVGRSDYWASAASGSVTLSCVVALDAVSFDVHVRLGTLGRAEVTAPLALRLSPDPWRT
jgi:SAM-dependent methyltransferase